MKPLLAIYGGTFSPPHLGHIRAAESFLAAVRPEKLLILPSALPPHKAPVAGASAEDRLAMCRMAFSHLERTEISDLEIRRMGKSYTVLTLSELAGQGYNLSMLVGTDMFLSLSTWHRAEEVFSLTEIAVIRREDEGDLSVLLSKTCEQYRKTYGAVIRFIEAPTTVISSTEIRERLKRGEKEIDGLTPEVEAYIRKWHLYQE